MSFESQDDATRAAREDATNVFVATDHNPDRVRTYYEIPDAVAERVRPPADRRTFVQALSDLLVVGRTSPTDFEPTMYSGERACVMVILALAAGMCLGASLAGAPAWTGWAGMVLLIAYVVVVAGAPGPHDPPKERRRGR